MQTQRSNRQHIQGARQKAIYKELDGFSVSHGIRTCVSLHGKPSLYTSWCCVKYIALTASGIPKMVWPSVKLDKMASPRAASMPQLSLGSTLRNFFSANDKCALTGRTWLAVGDLLWYWLCRWHNLHKKGLWKKCSGVEWCETCIISLKNEQWNPVYCTAW